MKKEERYLYEERETIIWCRVYNYTLDTAKKMKAKGWTLSGTYYECLTFWKDKF